MKTTAYVRYSSLPMTIIEHNRAEWSRMADAAASIGRSDVAARFRDAATRQQMTVREYDALQNDYRAWLVFNEYPVAA